MKKPPSFGRFLLTMVFLLEGLSLAIVIGFLFAMLDRSMTQEQVSQIDVQRAELRLYLTNRLNYTHTRVEEICANNNIKIGLLLGMDARIDQNMLALYPQSIGSSFYVRSADGRFFPKPRYGHCFLSDSSLILNRSDDIAQIAVNPHTFVYSAPIVQQGKILGHAVGVYDLSADPHCSKLLASFKDLALVYKQKGQLTDLFTHRPLAMSSPRVTESLTQTDYQHASDESHTQLIGMKEFPSLFLVVDNMQYRQRRWAMVTQLVVLCVPLFFLTFTFSFLILKKVTSTLDALAKNALHIAETDDHSDLDTTKVRHAEFLYLTRAFNNVLSKVRQQTGDLTQANENLQQQIEERQQMAEALKESEAQLRSLQANIPIGLFRRTIDGQLLFANPKLVSIFGYESEEEMYQIPIRHLYYYPEQYDQVMEQFRKSDNIQILELRFKRKDGTPLWCAVHLNKTTDPKSGTAFIDGALLDITDRKKIEDEKHKLETQLRQAHKMEAVGTLAGGIAHDFNNILFAIIGFCELALEEAVPETGQQENLQEAIAGAHRAAELVRQILTFARQTEVQNRPLNLSTILKESLKLLRATMPSTIDIRTELKGDHTVLADPTQMHQIIVNLCTNAGHAMRNTGGVLTIKLKNIDIAPGHKGLDARLTHGGNYIWLKVEDTGHGMSKETIERIFDPYFTTKSHGEGTGMGLSVVQGIVSSLNGVIRVESVLGKGSTFNIYLPALEKKLPLNQLNMVPIVGGEEHILFVDDELVLTRMASQMLSNLGYKVTTRNSAIEALELFRHDPQRFDLVISDVTMPNMTGKDLAREIMKIRPDLPFLLCTGYSENINEEIASSIGVRAMVYKPLARYELSSTIRRVLDNRSAA